MWIKCGLGSFLIVIFYVIAIIIVLAIGAITIVTIMNMSMNAIMIMIMMIMDNLLHDCVAQKELPVPIPKRKNDDVTCDNIAGFYHDNLIESWSSEW